MACLAITEAIQTTPTPVMNILLDLPPLHLVVEAEALKAAYRLRTNDFGTPQVQVRQHNEIFIKLGNNHIFFSLSCQTAS